MLSITYSHTKQDNGNIVLEDFRYADDQNPETVYCELVDNTLIWHITPNDFVRGVVENCLKKVSSEEYNIYYGLKETFIVPENSLNKPLNRKI